MTGLVSALISSMTAGMDKEEGVRSVGIQGSCEHVCPDSEIERRLRIEHVTERSCAREESALRDIMTAGMDEEEGICSVGI